MGRHAQTARVIDMNNVREVTTEELQKGIDRDNGLHLLNVQTDRFFTGELIPGSRRVPLDAIVPGFRNLSNVSKDAEIVTYCTGPGCSQSIDAARKLADLGYTNVRAYTHGLDGWKEAGNEIVVMCSAARSIPSAQ